MGVNILYKEDDGVSKMSNANSRNLQMNNSNSVCVNLSLAIKIYFGSRPSCGRLHFRYSCPQWKSIYYNWGELENVKSVSRSIRLCKLVHSENIQSNDNCPDFETFFLTADCFKFGHLYETTTTVSCTPHDFIIDSCSTEFISLKYHWADFFPSLHHLLSGITWRSIPILDTPVIPIYDSGKKIFHNNCVTDSGLSILGLTVFKFFHIQLALFPSSNDDCTFIGCSKAAIIYGFREAVSKIFNDLIEKKNLLASGNFKTVYKTCNPTEVRRENPLNILWLSFDRWLLSNATHVYHCWTRKYSWWPYRFNDVFNNRLEIYMSLDLSIWITDTPLGVCIN